MSVRIGFMQGRLSPLVDGRIQAFPWEYWQEEFGLARDLGLRLMEWTLDHERLHENPLLTESGRVRIRELSGRHDVAIPSLTGDCFMQTPFWKSHGSERESLHQDFLAIGRACASIGIRTIVVPLVDNGRPESAAEQDALSSFLKRQTRFLVDSGLRVAFESDLGPADLARFIEQFDPVAFGINYDIGNSAAMGFDSDEELSAYGSRVVNVHIKDRALRGTTVPLGTGNADFGRVFASLGRLGYTGNYILQTARAPNGDHAQVLARYQAMAVEWVEMHGA